MPTKSTPPNGEPPAPNGTQKIIDLTLENAARIARHPNVQHECRVAIFDLLEENYFAPKAAAPDAAGGYRVRLSVTEKGILLNISNEQDKEIAVLDISLRPFRRIIKDYFLLCENYYEAIRSATPEKIETMDMGRRSLHDEGAKLLKEKLTPSVAVDWDTARRLFTLICVLHMRG